MDEKQKSRSSAGQKRRNEEADEEDQTTLNVAGPSSASTSTPQEPSKKRQRTNNAVLDPITSDDRDQWIDYVVQSEEIGEGHYDLLNEFLSTVSSVVSSPRHLVILVQRLHRPDRTVIGLRNSGIFTSKTIRLISHVKLLNSSATGRSDFFSPSLPLLPPLELYLSIYFLTSFISIVFMMFACCDSTMCTLPVTQGVIISKAC